MKHLKLFESFREEDIHSICRNYGIRNYTINEDGSIDVDGNVVLGICKLNKLPLKFRNVSGDFYCHCNYLTSLEGCPNSVGGHFNCRANKLTSLEGCPESVGGYFLCSENKLKSLEGCPKLVNVDFNCSNNLLTSLEGCPESVGDDFICYNNELTSLEGCPESVGGDFDCTYNKIVTFEHLPFLIGYEFFCDGNPIDGIWDLFHNYSKIEFLNDCDALRESDDDSEEPIIILDRLNYFLEEIGKKPIKSVKGYKCI